jgi:hypothetical protein
MPAALNRIWGKFLSRDSQFPVHFFGIFTTIIRRIRHNATVIDHGVDHLYLFHFILHRFEALSP